MTDQEINEAVGKKLGYSWPPIPVYDTSTGETKTIWPNYSTDISAAWEIVDLLHKKWVFVSVEASFRGWRCLLNSGWFTELQNERSIDASADTAPMAICLAFLKLP